MAVGGPERVAEMVASLQVGSHAAHPPAPDLAVATEAGYSPQASPPRS
jgi:hypothetical protein